MGHFGVHFLVSVDPFFGVGDKNRGVGDLNGGVGHQNRVSGTLREVPCNDIAFAKRYHEKILGQLREIITLTNTIYLENTGSVQGNYNTTKYYYPGKYWVGSGEL